MSDGELEQVVVGCNIYARASPENKLRIVRALQVGGFLWRERAGVG
jgi:magnesium-transporting ATPase (P-type)